MTKLKTLFMTCFAFTGLFAVACLATELAESDIPNSTQSIDATTFVVFDTETTGFSAKNDRILEVGAVKLRNGKVIDSKSWLINPGRDIPGIAENVHHISEDMVKNKPGFADFYPEFEDFIRGSVLMAHNARFDVSMVRAELERAGIELPPNPVIDSLALYRRWYPEAKSHSLGALANYLQVNGKGFHRAEADSLYDALILFKGLEKKPGVDTLAELYTDAGGPIKF